MKSTFLNLIAAAVMGFVPMALSAQVPSYVPTDGLVGWWPFNGNANDESGNGNDGVVNGATLAEDRNAVSNSAYYFSGSGCGTRVDISNMNYGGTLNSFSISFWMKRVADGCISPRLFEFGSGNGWGVNWVNGLSNMDWISSHSLQNDTWYSVSYVLETGRISSYINGEFDSQHNVTNSIANWFGSNICFGRMNHPAYDAFNGLLDDIAIYNRALTPAEITQLYNAEVPVVECTPLAPNLQNGLVGYWPFCGNANDESGNGNDGVVNGATLTEDRFGNANAAYSFNGGADEISAPMTNYSEFTVSFWSYADNYIDNCSSNTTGSTLLSHKAPNANGNGFVIEMFNGSNASWIVNTNAGLGFQQYPQVLPLGQWYNIIMTTQPNGPSKLFLNGQLIDENNLNLTILGGQLYPFRIGAHTDGNTTCHFTGKIDDVAYWNRALTPEEVQELYTLDACTFTVYDTLTVENIINVYDTLTIENIVDIYDTTYINVEVYDTLTVENIINVYDTLTIENIVDIFDTTYINVEVYDTLTIENVIDVYDTTMVFETQVVYDTLTIENMVDVYDTLTIENVIDVYDTTTFVETITVYDTLTVENVVDVYDTTYITVTDTLIIDVPSGVGGTILNTLLLYPNPTSDQLTISYGNFAAMAGYSLSIFDNGGNTVHETNITQAQETLDISQWSAGVYQVVVYNAGGVPVETRQIVIQ